MDVLAIIWWGLIIVWLVAIVLSVIFEKINFRRCANFSICIMIISLVGIYIVLWLIYKFK